MLRYTVLLPDIAPAWAFPSGQLKDPLSKEQHQKPFKEIPEIFVLLFYPENCITFVVDIIPIIVASSISGGEVSWYPPGVDLYYAPYIA